jgi:hypothetical protein
MVPTPFNEIRHEPSMVVRSIGPFEGTFSVLLAGLVLPGIVGPIGPGFLPLAFLPIVDPLALVACAVSM